MSIAILFLFLTVTFEKQEAVDYSNLDHWAAHPEQVDAADLDVSPEIIDDQENAEVDVFFIHPTTFVQKTKWNIWNADLNDPVVNERTDELPIKNQATVFNGSTRIYAPRYRQAHLKAFWREDRIKSRNAINRAYEDVRDAFEYYLEHWNGNRPIIIASHSQGTRHAQKLLKDFFDGQQLADKLVAAYLIGGYVPKSAFDSIKVCSESTETGCFVAWRTYSNKFQSKNKVRISDEYAVVNPVNWTLASPSSEEEHLGVFVDSDQATFTKVKLSAYVSHNMVIVTIPSSMEKKVRNGNLHNYDYNLFYFNIRQNIAERVATYFQK